MRISRFLPGLVLGLLIGAVVFGYSKAGVSLLSAVGELRLPTVQKPTVTRSIVRCPADISTTNWQLYRNDDLGYELRYPAEYALQEDLRREVVTLTKTGALADGTNIVLEKIRNSLSREMLPQMQNGGWKVGDRLTYTLTTPYFTDDDGMLTSVYLFVRDFPLAGGGGTYSMVRATIRGGLDSETFKAARVAGGIIDPDSLLTEPEQILSTFRLLQYEELPGRN